MKTDKISRVRAVEELDTRATGLDKAAVETRSDFLRAIYQAQSQALREAAAAFRDLALG